MRGIFLMGVCLSTSEELFRVKFTVALMHFEVREGGTSGSSAVMQSNLGPPSPGPMHTRDEANEARRDLIYGAT